MSVMLIACRFLLGLCCAASASGLSAQSLEPKPDTLECGAEFEIRAVDDEGQPVEGVEVRRRTSPTNGEGERLGTTDAEGVLRSTAPEEAGAYRIEAEIQGIRCITPLRVLERRQRWPYALVGAVVAAFVVGRLRAGRR